MTLSRFTDSKTFQGSDGKKRERVHRDKEGRVRGVNYHMPAQQWYVKMALGIFGSQVHRPLMCSYSTKVRPSRPDLTHQN